MFIQKEPPDAQPLADKAALGERASQQILQSAEQKIMQMSESVIAEKSRKTSETIALANQGVQATKQIAALSGGLNDNVLGSNVHVKNFTSDNSSNISDNSSQTSGTNAATDPQQQAMQLANALGILPQLTAEITIAGEAMNRYSHFTICEQSDQHHHFSITYDHSMEEPESTPLAKVF